MFQKLFTRNFLGFLSGFAVILAASFFSLIVVSVYASQGRLDLPAAVSFVFKFFN